MNIFCKFCKNIQNILNLFLFSKKNNCFGYGLEVDKGNMYANPVVNWTYPCPAQVLSLSYTIPGPALLSPARNVNNNPREAAKKGIFWMAVP